MIYSIMPSVEIASYVEDTLATLGQDLQSITITRLAKSEDFCVSVVINSGSDETLETILKRYESWSSTSNENTQDG